MLQLPNNPLLRYAICKSKNGFTGPLSGKSTKSLQPWKLILLFQHSTAECPKPTLKWAVGRTPMVRGPSLSSVSKAPLEFRHQSSCTTMWNSFSLFWPSNSLESKPCYRDRFSGTFGTWPRRLCLSK